MHRIYDGEFLNFSELVLHLTLIRYHIMLEKEEFVLNIY